VKASTLGTVKNAKNAAALGGLLAGAYQRRIAGACTGGKAIRSIGPSGGVGYHATVPAFARAALPAGPHTVDFIGNTNSSSSDSFDRWTVVVFELPH
jgi:hypothetical protein